MSIKKIYRQDKGSQGMALVSQVGMQLPRELQKRHERKERKIKRKKDRTVEKRSLGDRKYRKYVFALPTLVFITHILPASLRCAVSPFAGSKNKKEKETVSYSLYSPSKRMVSGISDNSYCKRDRRYFWH